MNSLKINYPQVLEVKTSLGYKIIAINNIVFLEAKGKFTIIHVDDQSEIITYHLLKWYTENFSEPYFFRCHYSYLINCSYVNCYTYKEIVMKDGSKVPLSRGRLSILKENLSHIIEIQANS
ncbi:MAG: LytTR family transcriptional regulator DNA-binding domain-containing protein [Bacteroidales bacterium]|nr:LytTR family transcriptional regulator DNA-binding domain-containing protein [Bacteroidales bacterium]